MRYNAWSFAPYILHPMMTYSSYTVQVAKASELNDGDRECIYELWENNMKATSSATGAVMLIGPKSARDEIRRRGF